MNKTRCKDLAIGALASALLLGSVGGAVAAGRTATLDVLYNNIKLVVDGVQVTPKDATGKTVEPFVYEGTTYLPVRAVGEAVGKKVEWDGASGTVYLGVKPGSTAGLLDLCPPYETSGMITYLSDPKKTFSVMGQSYSSGMVAKDDTTTYALFNLNGAYDTVSFDICHLDASGGYDKTLYIYLDGVNTQEYTVTTEGLPQHIEFSVQGALQLKLEVSGNSWQGKNAIYNMTIQ